MAKNTNARIVAVSGWRQRQLDQPSTRPLKVYAFDPSRGHYLGNEMTLQVPYEPLKRGPTGCVVAVVDYDATNQCYYDPVDLEDKIILLCGGLDPSESDPHFHQQMVYAVTMETVQQFEAALGRRIHWRIGDYPFPRRSKKEGKEDITVLKLYPHAMMDRNAFYSPEARGILFGYFRASEKDPGKNLPGQTVFTCLSHDIIAHETTHAIIDGIRKYFTEPTNVDVAAFHEAFADIVALFRHFSHKEALLDAIQRTGGNLFKLYLEPTARQSSGESSPTVQAQIANLNPLIELAQQFGEATEHHASLRSALGTACNPRDYATKMEPHERGSILVAAMFDAYFTIYLRRTANLFRLYRAGGGGIANPDVPASLADLLAAEASGSAQQFFRICVRALDYCPSIDITFGDFLRAIITVHYDLQPDDADGVRDAFMEAFRLRGIVPEGASFFSEDALRWPKVPQGKLPPVKELIFGDPNGLTRPERDSNGKTLRAYAKRNAGLLGFDTSLGVDAPSFHPMFRIGPDGRLRTDMVVELVQERDAPFDSTAPELGVFPMRGGATVIISKPLPDGIGRQAEPQVCYVIAKHLHGKEGEEREKRQRQFYVRNGLLEGDPNEKKRFRINFALIHGGD